MPINGLSAATQNIILLRHIEHRATMLRVMAILKVRDDAYDGRMREMQITDDGTRAAGHVRRRVQRGIRRRRLERHARHGRRGVARRGDRNVRS